MSDIKDGGPAFPIPLQQGQGWQGMAPCDGMTLRDYFAAKWLQGWVANPELPDMTPDKAAAQAYLVADAMLAAREAK